MCSMKTQFYIENLLLMRKELYVLFGRILFHYYQTESIQKPDKCRLYAKREEKETFMVKLGNNM